MNTTLPNLSANAKRIESIDLLRGVVMIIMALDHVRDYFHGAAYVYNPTDLSQTNVIIFFTRWITHFCAPVFVFLAGTSAFMVGTRKGKAELTAFLFKRGLWLIVLEFTVINFSWFFNLSFNFIALTVIWGLGMGMIILSLMVRLPFKLILIVGLILVFGHNLLDGVSFPANAVAANFWGVLLRPHFFTVGHFNVFVGYPVLPWAGVMMLGYCFGKLYASTTDASYRKKILIQLGIGSILLFTLIRFFNSFGDPSNWKIENSLVYTFLSFINVTKYPPSILYILITLGPAFIFLVITEKYKSKLTDYVTSLGRVPMFYYIIHIYLIHIIALFAALATGFSISDMTFTTWITDSKNLKGYGFSLTVVYLVWAAVVLALFPLCLWYERYKAKHKEKWWLSYL